MSGDTVVDGEDDDEDYKIQITRTNEWVASCRALPPVILA